MDKLWDAIGPLPLQAKIEVVHSILKLGLLPLTLGQLNWFLLQRGACPIMLGPRGYLIVKEKLC